MRDRPAIFHRTEPTRISNPRQLKGVKKSVCGAELLPRLQSPCQELKSQQRSILKVDFMIMKTSLVYYSCYSTGSLAREREH